VSARRPDEAQPGPLASPTPPPAIDAFEAPIKHQESVSRPLEAWDLLETLADAVVAVRQGCIVYVNAAAERLHDAPRASLLGRPISALIPSFPELPAGPPIEVTVLRGDGSGVCAELTTGSEHAGVTVATLRPSKVVWPSEEARLDRLAPALLRTDVAEAFSSSGTLDVILARATDAIVQHLGVAVVRVWLLDQDGLILRLVASSGRSVRRDGAYDQIRLGDLRVGQIAREKRVFITNDLPNDPILGNGAWAPREGMVAFAGYPLLIGREVVGVCAAFSTTPMDGDRLEALASVVVVIAHGVERLRTEEAILASRAELAVILESIAEGVVGRDHEGKVVYANEAAARIFGLSAKEALLGTQLDELLAHVELCDESGANLPWELMPGHVVMVEGHEAERLLGIRTSPTREVRWLLAHAKPLREGASRSRFVTVYRDVTEHKRVEQGWRFLAGAGVALASVVDQSAIFTAAADFAVPSFAEVCAIFELDEASGALHAVAVRADNPDPGFETRAREIWQRFPPNPNAEWGIGRALRTGLPSLHPTMDAIYHASAQHDPEYSEALRAFRFHSAMIVPLLVRGRVLGACVFGSVDAPHAFDELDLSIAVEFGHRVSVTTEVSLLLNEAREGVRARNAFLSIASHELKTPITTLSLQAQALERIARAIDHVPAAQVLERGGKIRLQARRLTALVDRLLDVTRIGYGRLVLDIEEVCLADLVREVASRFDGDAADASPITVEAADSVVGQWDRVRLDEVVTNLVSNAIKYGRGQPILIRLSAEDERVRLEVIDHGIGIAAADQPELFHRFQRFVSDRDYGGFGLGLWISHQLVEAMGGTLRATSRLGEGSTFTVDLPRRRVPDAMPPDPA
jgi:PAS domain S-box-containing protein